MAEEERIFNESILKEKKPKKVKPKVNNVVMKQPKDFSVRQLSGMIGDSVEGTSSRAGSQKKVGGSNLKSQSSISKSNEMNLGSYTAERMEGLDPRDFINKTANNKRNFFLVLFRMYNDLPFQLAMESFSKVYNEVLIKEIPSVITKYALCELQIAELPNLADNPNDPMNIPFKFNFAKGTTKNLNYSNSFEYMNALKVLC